MGFISQSFNDNQDTGITTALTNLGDSIMVASGPIGNGPPADTISANFQLTVTMSGDGTNTNGAIVCYISRSNDEVVFDDNNFTPPGFNLAPLGSFTVDSTTTNTYVFSMDSDVTGTLPFAFRFVVYNNSSGTIASGSAIYCTKEYFAF